MSFLVWSLGPDPGTCNLLEVENVDDDFELTAGTSRRDGWPDDALFRMDPDRKKDIGLADVLDGVTLHVISGRLASALKAEGVENIELLPVKILNHKGRLASKDYFIMNPQDVCDCIDEAASGAQRNSIDPETISDCDALVLREDVIPKRLQVFRLERWREVIIIRRTLAEKLEAAGFSGLFFVECSDFMG